ncbi:tryptophan--tRNA ligase [Candidatus Wolfebacteria bacterium]|nr:tryptophan--tRNA ligase [Candidatus Wolfebacteria bacterium]
MSDEKKILLSGVKPTGRPHIGNYLGAMKQFVDLQDKYASHIMIADFHDLGSQTPDDLRSNTLEIAIDHLAIGLDPEKVVFFRQSDVPEHTELAWIFNGVVTVPYLQRAHAYKDAVAKGKEPIMTLFAYPVLMATDILMYDADVVPVGQDQKQHVEYARDIAQKFNNTYGDTFKLPEPLILESVATVPGTDGQKMSKSYNNTIPLFANDEEIEKAVMSIVTDSGTEAESSLAMKYVERQSQEFPRPVNLFLIHRLFRGENELVSLYKENRKNYKKLKEMLTGDMKAFITPFRERREAIAKDTSAVLHILKNGGERAREKAQLKMRDVRTKVGLPLH